MRIYSESDVEDVVGYPESDNDLARATHAAVSRKRTRTSAENGAIIYEESEFTWRLFVSYQEKDSRR